ncbi:MAG TPA: GH116 family glycosyl hydrolase [Jiangellaceae bacterium]|nr:GH116 family glycosyl hydrolase [Jiangellaceae bacterium]
MPTSQWARAERYGFTATRWPSSATPDAPQTFAAKPRSHDDGPGHGMFLGPIGGPTFSRDLSGRFSRWHLQPGRHLLADVDAAYLAVHWEQDGEHRHVLLRSEHVDRHDTAVLYPVSHERFTGEDLPFVVTLSSFSPVIPGYEQESGLPVVVFEVRVEPVAGVSALPAVDVALFWPNLGGWRASPVTSDDRGDRAWPGHHHAGNINVAGTGLWPASLPGTCVLQGRESAGARDASQVCVSVSGSADSFSRQVQFKTDQNATGIPDAEQEFTIGAVRHAFASTGRLGVTPDGSWPAHWHEPVGSAVAGHVDAGRDGATVRFVLAFDWPTVQFGMGRTWRRAYTTAIDEPGAVGLAARAHQQANEWLAAIDGWHERTLGRLSAAGWSPPVAGCVINELGLVPALGSAWVEGTAPGHEPAQDAVLSGREHVGLLEGFDEGYFYYNTSDLWHYAFPALTLHWPRLAEVIFADLADALAGADERTRPVYRVGAQRQMLQAHHLPHDMGSALEDPFVRLNGYVMRDDPNTWRDSGPAHVLARLLHARLAQRPVSEAVWQELCTAAEVTTSQTGDRAGDGRGEGTGVPRHDEFGDSTWDNLALRGYSTYAASLCAGMWAVLAREAGERGEDTAVYEARRAAAAEVLGQLWNGEFFRAASEGKYVQAVMPDSVWGLFYAERCGATTGVDRERIRGHLRAAYEICHRGYDDGRVGPLLIGERGGGRYDQDGGEELQVNEVIIGSAWMFAAMLRYYGLAAEADEVAGSLREVLYGGSGLQFRTPAAVDRDGRFRAPLNLRPLAAWWLAADAPRA